MKEHLIKIVQHSAIYGLGNIAVALTGFLLIPLYTNYLSPEAYGIYSLITLFMALLTFFYDLGLYKAMFSWYFDFSVEQKERKTIVSTVLFSTFVFSLIWTLLFLLFPGRVSELVANGREYSPLVRLAVLTVFFNNLMIIPFSVLRLKEKPGWFATASFVRIIGIVGLNFLFIATFKRGLLGLYESGLIVALAMTILLFLFTRKEYILEFSGEDFKRMFKLALPFFPTVFFAWIIDFSGRYFLKLYTTLEQVGLYSLGYKVGQVTMFTVSVFILGWVPILFSIAKEKNAPEIFGRVMTYFFSVVAFVSVLISVFGKELIRVFASPFYMPASQVIPIIATSYLLYGAYMFLLTGLLIKKEARSQPLILAVAAGVNVGLNILLIPRLGMMGAALATLATYLLVAGGTYFASQKIYFIPYEFDRILKSLFITLLVYFLSLLIRSESLAYALSLKFALMIVMYPALLYLTKFFKQEELAKLRALTKVVSL
ncbi:MAG: oligosaccharide flippase family protein [Candidatus Omnitrophota bacterium]